MSKRFWAVLLSALMVVALLAGCAGGTENENAGETADMPQLAAEDIKAGFVYIGPPGDEGWTYAHDQGRKMAEETLGIETTYVENVPENADCEKTIRDLIDQGCNVIVTCSLGFMDWTYNVAQDHPEVYFFHCSGDTTAPNMSAYFGRMYQARYLSGIAAGLNTESNKIGYVAAMPVPEVIRGIDAFTLGARSVNPEATVEVVWTNTWYDPSVEKAAAIELLNGGCDVIAQHQDTTAPQIAAQENGAKTIGYNTSTVHAAPEAYLTAPLFDWGTYYVAEFQKIIDGTWESSQYWGGMKDGIVKLDELTENCAEGTKEAVEAAQQKIMNDELYIFEGPLNDNEGNEKVAEETKMTDEEIWTIDWFVEGVIGSAE